MARVINTKEVDLLSYWMPLLRKLYEFKQIAMAEEPELRYILEAIHEIMNKELTALRCCGKGALQNAAK